MSDLEQLEHLIYKASNSVMRPHATCRYASTILDSDWLEQVKAEAWDEGYSAALIQQATGKPTRNPYYAKGKAS